MSVVADRFVGISANWAYYGDTQLPISVYFCKNCAIARFMLKIAYGEWMILALHWKKMKLIFCLVS